MFEGLLQHGRDRGADADVAEEAEAVRGWRSGGRDSVGLGLGLRGLEVCHGRHRIFEAPAHGGDEVIV